MKFGIVTCALTVSLWAQNARKPNFVSPEQLDVKSILASPPASDSWQTRMELAELHRLQETRTEAEVAHAKADDAQEDIFIYGNVLGAGFARANLPLTARLSDYVHADESVIVNPAKTAFHRPRPLSIRRQPQTGLQDHHEYGRLFLPQRARDHRLPGSVHAGHDGSRKTRGDPGSRRRLRA